VLVAVELVTHKQLCFLQSTGIHQEHEVFDLTAWGS